MQPDSTWESPIDLLSASPIADEWPYLPVRGWGGFYGSRDLWDSLNCVIYDFKIRLLSHPKHMASPEESQRNEQTLSSALMVGRWIYRSEVHPQIRARLKCCGPCDVESTLTVWLRRWFNGPIFWHGLRQNHKCKCMFICIGGRSTWRHSLSKSTDTLGHHLYQ